MLHCPDHKPRDIRSDTAEGLHFDRSIRNLVEKAEHTREVRLGVLDRTLGKMMSFLRECLCTCGGVYICFEIMKFRKLIF